MGGKTNVHGPLFYSGSSAESYLRNRHAIVKQSFPDSLGVDDFMSRAEIELFKYGFSADTSIACLNLCRDEICNSLKKRIENVFGHPFNIHGLGGVLTCGVIGMKAGLSHAPLPVSQTEGGITREKYIFFSFPHIAISDTGAVGHIGRRSRPHSHACGALLAVLGQLKGEECKDSCHKVGRTEEHEKLDPEYSILKHRLEQHIGRKNITHESLDLVSITKLAEEAIRMDLQTYIHHAVDVSKADYAVVSGVQIHNWSDDFTDGVPNFEFIAPASTYVVVDGKRTDLNLGSVSALTSRMIRIICKMPTEGKPDGLAIPVGNMAVVADALPAADHSHHAPAQEAGSEDCQQCPPAAESAAEDSAAPVDECKHMDPPAAVEPKAKECLAPTDEVQQQIGDAPDVAPEAEEPLAAEPAAEESTTPAGDCKHMDPPAAVEPKAEEPLMATPAVSADAVEPKDEHAEKQMVEYEPDEKPRVGGLARIGRAIKYAGTMGAFVVLAANAVNNK